MSPQLKYFLIGFRKTLPFLGGIIPFGVLYATLAMGAGFPWWLTILFSIIVFGGSSQLVFIDLYQTLLAPLQAVLGSNIVNARHLIYSAGVSNKFADFPLMWKMVLSYLLTDQLYAISESEKETVAEIPRPLAPWFYFGSGMCTWVFWILSSALGIAFGQLVPASWNLAFSIPLMFMPLIFSVSHSRAAYVTCAFAILFVYLFKSFPYGLGVFFAIILSSLVGYSSGRLLKVRR